MAGLGRGCWAGLSKRLTGRTAPLLLLGLGGRELRRRELRLGGGEGKRDWGGRGWGRRVGYRCRGGEGSKSEGGGWGGVGSDEAWSTIEVREELAEEDGFHGHARHRDELRLGGR